MNNLFENGVIENDNFKVNNFNPQLQSENNKYNHKVIKRHKSKSLKGSQISF